MNISRLINYILILIGGFVAIYAQAGEEQSVAILISGIVILMIGLYRTSRNISSNSDNQNKDDLE